MARTREFDPEDLLTAAVQIFWKKGYAETSMRDIVQASGIAHAGVYKAFGNKRDLYIKCIQRYDQRFGDIALGQLEKKDSDIADIQAFFEMVADGVAGGRLANGCLMGNTVIEFGSDATEIVGLALKFIKRMTKAFKGTLKRAQKKGQLDPTNDPAAVAQYLTTYFYGLMTMVRAGTSVATVRANINFLLANLK